MHRDLKTDNILLCKNKKYVKLIDFGFANICQRDVKRLSLVDENEFTLTETKGTPYYMSPEVYRGKYDKRCDLWSIGVITYYLLSGKLPFMASNEDELEQLILSTDFDYNGDEWDSISAQAKSFIDSLIEPNVNKRLSCKQALTHPWI